MSDQDDQDNNPAQDDEMSDEEAMRLLEEMDDSVAEPNPEPSSDDMSDDEALALLAEMDGSSETAAPEAAGETEEVPDITEISEWEANDFQSDTAMMQDFISSADDLMENLNEQLLALESDPTNKDTIEEIFRAAHTLKGASGMFGFKALERVMHRLENLFDLIRKGKLTPGEDVIDLFLQGMDTITALIGAARDGKPCGIKTGELVFAIEQVAEGKSPIKISAPKQPVGDAAPSDETPKQTRKKDSLIKVDLTKLDTLVNLIGELVIDRTRLATVDQGLRHNFPHEKTTAELSETLQHFSRHMNDVQDIIMKVRMVPIGNAFNKYPRIVRDLAKSLDKRINLVIVGEQHELDKTMVEQLADPLVHLIRNACDHGVELPDDRTKSGKPETGIVKLSASQEGNQILISIEDDGKGMDRDIILSKAIEKGLATEGEELSNQEVFNMIFEPGFSTAAQVTNVSGRGVGMDVVKRQITQLKGTLTIDSTLGKGSRIEIRLPLTLAIVQSLMVRCGQTNYAVPIDSVSEITRITAAEIEELADTRVIKLRDEILPIIYLESALSREDQPPAAYQFDSRYKYVIIAEIGERRFGMVVDQLLNRQEMVIKSLGPMLEGCGNVSGGAVIGDGSVVLVADILQIANHFRARPKLSPSAEGTA